MRPLYVMVTHVPGEAGSTLLSFHASSGDLLRQAEGADMDVASVQRLVELADAGEEANACVGTHEVCVSRLPTSLPPVKRVCRLLPTDVDYRFTVEYADPGCEPEVSTFSGPDALDRAVHFAGGDWYDGWEDPQGVADFS